MLISCFTYGQGRDSLNSRVSVSFSSGVARGYVNSKMNFKNNKYIGSNSIYYDLGMQFRINKHFGLSNNYAYQEFSYGERSPKTESYMYYYNGGSMGHDNMSITRSYFFKKYSFDLNLYYRAFLSKKLSVNFSTGLQFSWYNATKTVARYNSQVFGSGSFTVDGFQPYLEYEYYNGSGNNNSYTANIINRVGLDYKIAKRVNLNLELGLSGRSLTFNDVSQNVYSTYIGLGIKKSFATSKKHVLNDSTIKKNNFYAEILGHGVWGSLNYERKLKTKKRPVFLHLGSMYYSTKSKFSYQYSFAITTGVYFLNKRKSSKKLELGFNFTSLGLEESFVLNISFGRRIYFANNTMLRFFISANPYYERHVRGQKLFFYPFLGISYGFCH